MASRRNEELLDRSREAALIESTVGPWVQDRIGQIVQRLVATYRGGTINHDGMLGGIAQISELMGMMSDLENKQQQGVVAAQQEFRNGPEKASR